MLADFNRLLRSSSAILALAPMQDVTDLPFWKLMAAKAHLPFVWRPFAGICRIGPSNCKGI
jgi:tRNA-dihydrouridine synthase